MLLGFFERQLARKSLKMAKIDKKRMLSEASEGAERVCEDGKYFIFNLKYCFPFLCREGHGMKEINFLDASVLGESVYVSQI